MIPPVSLAIGAVLLGYVVVVGCSVGMTLALTYAAPASVQTKHHHLGGQYKLAQAGVRIACTAIGVYTLAWLGDRGWAWEEGICLAGVLITVLWSNVWEARQQGFRHQMLLTLLTVIGVATGYLLRY